MRSDIPSHPWGDMTWTSEPPEWSIGTNGTLSARSGPRTDFWRQTHYGFVRDDGHALLASRSGAFTATLTFSGDYHTLYDQAGLMIRFDPQAWIKFGIELTDGQLHLSAVVTNGASDWSALPIMLDGPLTVRAARFGDAFLLQYQMTDTWCMARLAPFPMDHQTIGVGPYLCSPEREGFEAEFEAFAVTDRLVRGLHE